MAEPVGITGTAVGIVSLGLQLYGSLKDYVDDVKGRDAYVSTTLGNLECLRQSLDSINKIVPNLENEHPDSTQAVANSLQRCEVKLNALDCKLKSHEPTATPRDLKRKWKETKKRILFPFTKPELEKLASQIDDLNKLLSLALSDLKLHMNHLGSKQLTRIVNSNHSIATDTTAIVTQVNEIHSSQQSMVGFENRIASEVINAIIQHEQESPSQKLFQALMSKPDLLRRSQDELQSFQPAALCSSSTELGNSQEAQNLKLIRPQRRQNRIAGHCGCRHQRRKAIVKRSSQRSMFTYFDESIVETQHEPWCTRYHPSQVHHERTKGVTYMGLYRLFNVALVAAFTRTDGAGGRSISPMLKYVAVVDRSRARSFRILRQMTESLSAIKRGVCNESADEEIACQQVINHGLSKLKSLFSDRCASPTDIDENGATLIGYALIALHRARSAYIILITLLDLGVPGLTERYYWYFASQAFVSKYFRHWKEYLRPLVLSSGLNSMVLYATASMHLISLRECRKSLQGVEGAEAFGLDNPLCLAILQEDVEALRDVLRTVTITEDLLTVNGFPAPTLAIDWPEGFIILTQTCLDLGLDIPGRFSLFYILCERHRLCRQDPHSLNSDCHCEELVKIILDLKIPIDDFDVPIVIRDMAGASYALLEHIRYWRERLEALARQHLPISELQELGVSDGRVLDHAAPEVINRLEARGVSPSIEFGLERDDYRLSPPSNQASESSSIYHLIDDAWRAQIAFDLGFKDIDTFYCRQTPAMDTWNVHYIQWLLAHGADMNNILLWENFKVEGIDAVSDHGLPRDTVVHNLMRLLAYEYVKTMLHLLNGYILDREACSTIRSALDIVRIYCDLETRDGCDCLCTDSDGGCTPVHIFISWVFVIPHLKKQAIEDIQNLLSVTDDGTKARASCAMVRLLTFQKLKLRHTCCTAYPLYVEFDDLVSFCWFWDLEEWKAVFEDFPNIREEDALLSDELEDLMIEFREEFLNGDYTLSSFIETYWEKRMDEVEKEKEARRLTQAELDGMRELGIELQYESEDYESEDYEIEVVPERNLSDIVAEHIRKIDEIYMDK